MVCVFTTDCSVYFQRTACSRRYTIRVFRSHNVACVCTTDCSVYFQSTVYSRRYTIVFRSHNVACVFTTNCSVYFQRTACSSARTWRGIRPTGRKPCRPGTMRWTCTGTGRRLTTTWDLAAGRRSGTTLRSLVTACHGFNTMRSFRYHWNYLCHVCCKIKSIHDSI